MGEAAVVVAGEVAVGNCLKLSAASDLIKLSRSVTIFV